MLSKKNVHLAVSSLLFITGAIITILSDNGSRAKAVGLTAEVISGTDLIFFYCEDDGKYVAIYIFFVLANFILLIRELVQF